MKRKGFGIVERFFLIGLFFLVAGFVFGNASSGWDLFWKAVLACVGFFVFSFVTPRHLGDKLVRLMEFLGLILSVWGWVLIEDFFSESTRTIGLVVVTLGMIVFWLTPEFLELLLKMTRRRFERNK